METCYKAVRTDLLKSIPIESNDFRLEPELTIKLAKREARIFEVPISYSGRTYQEGKKIDWRDGLKALAAIVRFRHLRRHLRQGRLRQPHPRAPGPRAEVQRLDGRRRSARSAARASSRSAAGSATSRCGSCRARTLRRLRRQPALPGHAGVAAHRPAVPARRLLRRERSARRSPRRTGGYDTVVCLNVIEHIADDVQALANIGSVLADGGRAIVLVPQGPWNCRHPRRSARPSPALHAAIP